MRKFVLTAAMSIAACACGRSDREQLQDAANQSDPAAAQVLNEAARQGADPQQALEQAGQAAAAGTGAGAPASGSVQARPNLPQSPNRPDGTQPPDKGTGTSGQAGREGGYDTPPPPQ